MADQNNSNFVHFIEEICLMKYNAFHEDESCTSSFDSKGTKNT